MLIKLFAVCVMAIVSVAAEPPAAPDAEKPGPLAEVRRQLGATEGPFTLIVKLEIKPGSEAEFEKLAAAAAAGTRKEPGSLAYEFSRSTTEPRKVVLYERWKSFGDLQKHFEFDYMKAFMDKVHDLMAGSPELSVYVPMAGGK